MGLEIQALFATNPEFGRLRTSVNAATEAVSTLKVGESLCIKSFANVLGKPLSVQDAQMNIKLAGHRLGAKFITRNLKDGNLLHVWRLA